MVKICWKLNKKQLQLHGVHLVSLWYLQTDIFETLTIIYYGRKWNPCSSRNGKIVDKQKHVIPQFMVFSSKSVRHGFVKQIHNTAVLSNCLKDKYILI